MHNMFITQDQWFLLHVCHVRSPVSIVLIPFIVFIGVFITFKQHTKLWWQKLTFCQCIFAWKSIIMYSLSDTAKHGKAHMWINLGWKVFYWLNLLILKCIAVKQVINDIKNKWRIKNQEAAESVWVWCYIHILHIIFQKIIISTKRLFTLVSWWNFLLIFLIPKKKIWKCPALARRYVTWFSHGPSRVHYPTWNMTLPETCCKKTPILYSRNIS